MKFRPIFVYEFSILKFKENSFITFELFTYKIPSFFKRFAKKLYYLFASCYKYISVFELSTSKIRKQEK